MIADFFKSFSSLFSVTGIIWFLLGMLSEYSFLKLRCKYLDKTHPEEGKHRVKIKRVYWVWALVFIVIGGLTYKAQSTSEQVIAITKETQECSRQFNAALKARGEISTEESRINARLQDIQYQRTVTLANLMKQYGSNFSPEYLDAKFKIDVDYTNVMREVFNDRKEVQERRANIQYPEPTCGK